MCKFPLRTSLLLPSMQGEGKKTVSALKVLLVAMPITTGVGSIMLATQKTTIKDSQLPGEQIHAFKRTGRNSPNGLLLSKEAVSVNRGY